MPNHSSGSASTLVFSVSYEAAGDRNRNPELKGDGTLTIHPDGPTYVFSGRSRATFSGKAEEKDFKSNEIWNVTLADRRISFHTQRGKAGATGRPFFFFCRDAAEARSVAAMLPASVDEDFVAVRDFSARLNALTQSSNPWASVTNVIVGLNVLVFVVMGSLGAGWFEVKSLMPYILYGANQGAATTDGEWWRLLTSMFMHYGLLHLLLNMWALYQAGHFLEKLQGRWLYVLTYLGSGLAGGFASIAWHGDKTWSAGASSAVFGVFGAILGYLLREKQGLPKSLYQSLLKSSLTFAGYNIVFGFANAGIDNAAHLGGAAGGVVLGWLVALPVDRVIREQQSGRKFLLGTSAIVGLIVAGVLFTPRFDYSVREELAWTETNRPFTTRESALLAQNQTALAKVQLGEGLTTYADWLTQQLVPFYQAWGEKLAALTLEPTKRTAARRAELERIVQQRRDSLERLAAGLRNQQAGALTRYDQEEQKILGEISRFNEE